MADKDFTQRELEIMAKAWACMTEEPKVDYEKLAAACGMGNPRSAGNAWRAIKTKIMAKGGIAKADGGEEDGDSAVKPTPTPKKRGRGKAEKNDGESPTKKPKETKGRKSKAAKEASAEADDEEKSVSPVKGEPEDDGELN
ncbi:hypothetical protein LTR85_009719 [Meristemomyces frigidus]|nr:hypothetical protein LTR85_009719 [Meristemomyces frigidus]